MNGARATAALLDGIEGAVFTLGDHAYLRGTDSEFKRCYEPTWGVTRRARTRHPAITTT
jgi:alkaline phosphatase